eukprot:6636964-Prymnesium_polylepis.1
MPWEFTVWWANVVSMGSEMGEEFRQGLLRASGVTGGSLDLSGKLRGHLPTVLAAISELMSVLTELDISGNQLDEQAIMYLGHSLLQKPSHTLDSLTCDTFAVSKSTESLDLSRKPINRATATLLAGVIKANKALTQVQLDGSPVPIKQLKGAKSSNALSLSGMGLGAQSAMVIVRLLQFNKFLTDLDLSSNRLGALGGEEIGAALGIRTVCLTRLNLAFNDLGVRGGQAIADGLKLNHKLRELNLWANELSHGGADAIGEALKLNDVLATLDLSNNSLCGLDILGGAYTTRGVIAFCGALAMNKCLASLYLNGNGVGPEGAKAVASAL